MLRVRSFFATSVLAFLAGCTHNLEVCNLSRYCEGVTSDFSKRGIRVFLVCENYDPSSQMLCRQIGNQMARQGGYAIQSSPETEAGKSDVDVRVSVTTRASGRTSNFFVSWPGFILFTHVWLGYGYDVEYDVKCIVTNSETSEKIAEFTEPLYLELRHAEFDRTWAAGCGWLFLYTATAFVNGFYVMSYDEDITPQLYSAAFPSLAGKVAKRLVSDINASSILPVHPFGGDAADRRTHRGQSTSVERFERVSGDEFAYAFRLRLKDGADAGLSAMDRIKHELRATIAKDYVAAHGGRTADVQVDFPVFTLKDAVIEGRAEVMRIEVASLRYDPQAQKGVIAVKIGSNRFEDARLWVRKNIETLAKDKNVALTTGKIPPAARFYLGAERVRDGNILEIEFETE